MAAPWGPSPKLRAYLEWARTEGDCDVKEGHRGTKPCFRIESASGKVLHIVGMPDTETVSHSLIANWDRRLGLDAPFPKTPQPYR